VTRRVAPPRAAMSDLFARLSAQKPRERARRASGALSRSTRGAARDGGDATVDVEATPSASTRKRALGPSVSIVGDAPSDEVVSKAVPVPRTASTGRPPLRAVGVNGRTSAGTTREGNKRGDARSESESDGETSGDLMFDAERSRTSSMSAGSTREEEDRATEPLPRKTNARRTTRTPVTTARFDEQLKLAEATKRCLRETMVSIRANGLDPARVFASLAKQTPGGGGSFEALARAIDALSPTKPTKGKRLSFSTAETQTPVTVMRDAACDVSEDASFDSAGESFEATAEEEEVVEEEGTFPTCDCGAADCTLVKMHARGGPFALLDHTRTVSSIESESIAETDDENDADDESVAGTEVDDLDDLDDAMDALDLNTRKDDLDEDQTALTESEVVEDETIEPIVKFGTHIRFDDSIVVDSPQVAGGRDEVEALKGEPELPTAKIENHVRFEDSTASDSPAVASVRRPRARERRRKVILDSDAEDESESDEVTLNDDDNDDDEASEEDQDAPVVNTRPRRIAARKPLVPRNAFVDDDLSGSEDFDDIDDELHSSDDDFIDDDDDSYADDDAVEYDSDEENVTPVPRKPSSKIDLAKEMNDKLVIDEYSPSNLHTPTPPKELSPTSAVKAFRPPPSHSKALQSAIKSVTKNGVQKLNFNRDKDAITAALFAEFNEKVFDAELPSDFEVTWNKKLLTTAGLTHYKRSTKSGETTYSARIELSNKVLDTVEKLESTLLHEMCHASAWLVDKTAKPPHGPVFKKWASQAMKVYPETNVSTCHAYTIHQPYKWRCTRDWCQQEYGRHSKSIDITKKACGACGGKLEYLGKFKKNGDEVAARAPTAFSLFVKEHFKSTKNALGASTPHKDVMKHLSQRWKNETGKDEVIELTDE